MLVDLFKQFTDAYKWTPPRSCDVARRGGGPDRGGGSPGREPGRKSICPGTLPFEPGPYLMSTSFDPGPAKDKFQQLIKDPASSHTLCRCRRTMLSKSPTGIASRPSGRTRPEKELRYKCYANAGGGLAAMPCLDRSFGTEGPDGTPSQGPSGTEEHVAFKLKGRPPKHYPWTDAEPFGSKAERGW